MNTNPKRDAARAEYIRQQDLVDLPAHWEGPLPLPEPHGVQSHAPPSPSQHSTKTKRSGDDDFIAPENVKSRRTAETHHAPVLQVAHKPARNDDCTISIRRPQIDGTGSGSMPNHHGSGHNLNKDLPPSPRPSLDTTLNPVLVPNTGSTSHTHPPQTIQDTAIGESPSFRGEGESWPAQTTSSSAPVLQELAPQEYPDRSGSDLQDFGRDGSKTPIQEQKTLDQDANLRDVSMAGSSGQDNCFTSTPMQPGTSQDGPDRSVPRYIPPSQSLGDSARLSQPLTTQNYQASIAQPQTPTQRLDFAITDGQNPYPRPSPQNVSYSQPIANVHPAQGPGSQYSGRSASMAEAENPPFYPTNTVSQHQPSNHNSAVFNMGYPSQTSMQSPSQASNSVDVQGLPPAELHDHIMQDSHHLSDPQPPFNFVAPYTTQGTSMYQSPRNVEPQEGFRSHVGPQYELSSTGYMPQQQQFNGAGHDYYTASPGVGRMSQGASGYSPQQTASSGFSSSYHLSANAAAHGNISSVPHNAVTPLSSHLPPAFGTPQAYQGDRNTREFVGAQHQAQRPHYQPSQAWHNSNPALSERHPSSNPPPESFSPLPPLTNTASTPAKDGHCSVDELSSNASDTSTRRVRRKPARSNKRSTALGGQGSLSRQGSQPALAHQFGTSQSHANQGQPHQVSASHSVTDGVSAWPAAPTLQLGSGPLSSKAAGKRPETLPWTQQAQASSPSSSNQVRPVSQPASASLAPSSSKEQAPPSPSTQLSPAHTARLLEYMREMQEETNLHFRFVKENMLTRKEGATKAEVATLRDELSGIRTTHSVLATQERKRTLENSRRKGGLTSASAPSGSSSGSGRNHESYASESEADLPIGTSRPSSSKVKGVSSSLWNKMQPHANALKKAIREHVLKMIGIKDYGALAKKCPPLTEEEYEAYSQGLPDAPIVNRRKLRIDFENTWKKFSYNREVSAVILDDFIQAAKNKFYPYLALDDEFLQSALLEPLLDSHIKTLRQHYRLSKQTRGDKEQALEKKRENGSRMSRRTSLYQSRVMALSRRPALAHILALMHKMQPRNMSEDELVEPIYPPVYRIRPAVWQSTELRQCFQTVDELYRSDWGVGPKRRRPGNPPRKFLPSLANATSNVTAPSGLPRNCYSKKWLKSLKKHQLAALHVKAKIIDLSIPDDVDVQLDQAQDEDEGDYDDEDDERDYDEMQGVQEQSRAEGSGAEGSKGEGRGGEQEAVVEAEEAAEDQMLISESGVGNDHGKIKEGGGGTKHGGGEQSGREQRGGEQSGGMQETVVDEGKVAEDEMRTSDNEGSKEQGKRKAEKTKGPQERQEQDPQSEEEEL